MHRSVLDELCTCLKNIYARFNCFDIPLSNVQTHKNPTSVDSLAHNEYENLCLVSVDLMCQKLQSFIYGVVEMQCFIVISLMKQTLFLVIPIDVGTNYSLIDLAGNG